MPLNNFKLTESRIAVAISLAALVASVWQALENRTNNRLNEENLRVDVAIGRPLNPNCTTFSVGLIAPVEVLIINNSNQPVSLLDLKLAVVVPSSTQEPIYKPHVSITQLERYFKKPLNLAPKSHELITIDQGFGLLQRVADKYESRCKGNALTPAGPLLSVTRGTDQTDGDSVSDWGWPVQAIKRRQLGVRVTVKTTSDNDFIGYDFVREPHPLSQPF